MTARRILSQPGVCGGRPTFEGTRIEPSHIFYGFQQNDPVENVLEDFPSLTKEDLRAGIEFLLEKWLDD